VFVHPGVPLTLVAAALADCRAGLEERRDDVGVVLRLAADDTGGRDAYIGAVQAEPDAPDHLGYVLLAQVTTGVGYARLGAIVECVDRGGQQAGIDVETDRAGTQHLPCVAHNSRPVCSQAMAALGSAVRARLILPAFRIWTAQHIFPALVHYCDLPSLPPGVGYG